MGPRKKQSTLSSYPDPNSPSDSEWEESVDIIEDSQRIKIVNRKRYGVRVKSVRKEGMYLNYVDRAHFHLIKKLNKEMMQLKRANRMLAVGYLREKYITKNSYQFNFILDGETILAFVPRTSPFRKENWWKLKRGYWYSISGKLEIEKKGWNFLKIGKLDWVKRKKRDGPPPSVKAGVLAEAKRRIDQNEYFGCYQVKNMKITEGETHEYFGCEFCEKSFRTSPKSGPFHCFGCSKRTVETLRDGKLYRMIRELTVTDGLTTLSRLVVFHKESANLLRNFRKLYGGDKTLDDFLDDEPTIAGQITFRKRSVYGPTIVLSDIEIVSQPRKRKLDDRECESSQDDSGNESDEDDTDNGDGDTTEEIDSENEVDTN